MQSSRKFAALALAACSAAYVISVRAQAPGAENSCRMDYLSSGK
jgi:hypothetical protein